MIDATGTAMGRDAPSPWNMPAGGWWAALKRTAKEMGDDNVGLIAAGTVIGVIDAEQHLPRLHPLIVLDQHLRHSAGDLRADHGRVGTQIGVVGALLEAAVRPPAPAEHGDERDAGHGQPDAEQARPSRTTTVYDCFQSSPQSVLYRTVRIE